MSVSTMLRLAAWVAALGLGGCEGKRAQVALDASTEIRDTAEARAFVQRFYAWYAPRSVSGAAWAEVLKRDTLIHPVLLSLLKEDYAIRGNEAPPRSTIDGDPFMGQDPCPAFMAERAEPAGNRVRVTVKEQCAQPRIAPPVVYAIEVAHDGKHWRILDVYYGTDGTSLVGYLCQYALQDRRSEQRPATCAPP